MTSSHQQASPTAQTAKVFSNANIENYTISLMKKEEEDRKSPLVASTSDLREPSGFPSASSASPPTSLVSLKGQTFIHPNSNFARAVISGTGSQRGSSSSRSDDNGPKEHPHKPQQASNLTVLLNQQHRTTSRNIVNQDLLVDSVDEADSASGPPTGVSVGSETFMPLQKGSGKINAAPDGSILLPDDENVRRCMSSKELGTLAPKSGSPYVSLLYKMGEIETSMNQRFMAMKQIDSGIDASSRSIESSCTGDGSVGKKSRSNEMRNQRRAEHAKAVVDDLCDIVADLFAAESKLLNPSIYGVSRAAVESPQIKSSIHEFLSSLPLRYALGVESPSEVLLHMRLMAAVRENPSKVALHIHKTEDDASSRVTVNRHSSRDMRNTRLVTLSCRDVSGLLEFLSNLLATGGSRVLDADVMLSSEGIVLDRFIVEMTGRLRLDKMSKMIENFLKDKREESHIHGQTPSIDPVGGPIYYKHRASPSSQATLKDLEGGVPLTAMLATASHANLSTISLPVLRKRLSATPDNSMSDHAKIPTVNLTMRKNVSQESIDIIPGMATSALEEDVIDLGKRLPMMIPDHTEYVDTNDIKERGVNSGSSLDFVRVPGFNIPGRIRIPKTREVPLIPFEELMLIETIGTGRVSTIYRAAWQRTGYPGDELPQEQSPIQMVALKVAMLNPSSSDSSNVDELRREADIAARLSHPCVSSLVGVAADAECFCLAYDYCEGGSLLSLLNDNNRYYEYLPIALDIANGMAYLHSRNIIHRDLKPANVLLTREHRAKISDFGMSIKNHGQELTAETGTYRYMAPEVIRHESYSSNADVYSFGVCLWQLITREVPFKTMTPVQAAYAVAEGRRPDIPPSTPGRLREILEACWDHNSHKRPTFTYVAMALADYARLAFSPANVGAQTLQIANEMLATVEGNSTVNVDFTAPVDINGPNNDSSCYNIGLEIE